MNRSAHLLRTTVLASITRHTGTKAAIHHSQRAAICVAVEQQRAFHNVCMIRPTAVYNHNEYKQLSAYGDSHRNLRIHRWFSSEGATTEDDINVFYPGLVQRIQSGDLQLIDVRENEEVAKGQIAKSLHIPLKEVSAAFKMDPLAFEKKYGRPKPARDAGNLVFHCRAGVRSLEAVQMARKEGYPMARHFPGGWLEWAKENNLPAE